ncbi:MAG: AAA family ATPase, partial [Anaerolineae bacterium]|nr:AAA family ATPase [Anaerolineae bacterium]
MDNNQLRTICEQLIRSERAYLIAPAGYGKTQAISQAVALSDGGKQLVLTHTHAGVQSLRNRLRQLKVPTNNYEVDTIAGWALKLVICYPTTASLSIQIPPKSSEWKHVYNATCHILQQPFMRNVIHASYVGVFVDEYQDCTITQHTLVLELAKILPCRVLGDPLQGIFGFADEPLVDWENDVSNEFAKLPSPTIPMRWINRNERLGKWLAKARDCLCENRAIDLESDEIRWIQYNEDPRDFDDKGRQACYSKVKTPGTVIAIFPT